MTNKYMRNVAPFDPQLLAHPSSEGGHLYDETEYLVLIYSMAFDAVPS